MKPPIIRVEDWTQVPPLTIKYLRGDNELDLQSVYTAIKGLSKHPGCGVAASAGSFPATPATFRPCSKEFLNSFWTHFASVIDYLADFLASDDPTTRSVWFYLLDVLQDTAVNLPHDFWDSNSQSCPHAPQFARRYRQTLILVSTVITARRARYRNDGIVRATVPLRSKEVDKRPGGFKAGLKPWQQFLYNKSPGFTVPRAEQEFLEDDVYNSSHIFDDGETISEQHIPMGALGIIARHTERARKSAKKLVDDPNEARSEAEILADFDQHSLKIGESFSYTSLSGHQTIVQHMHPRASSANTPRRIPGLADPDNLLTNPDLNLLNECVGDHKGVKPFVHPRGNDDFQMWTVKKKKERENHKKDDVVQGLDELFDDWKVTDKDKDEMQRLKGTMLERPMFFIPPGAF